MYEKAQIVHMRKRGASTILEIELPARYAPVIKRKAIDVIDVWLDDGRHISGEQRRKVYATIRDIGNFLGYVPEEMKEVLKWYYMECTGDKYFSLSDCGMDTARKYINFILDFALEHGIVLNETLIDRTDDVDHALASCLRFKKCAICGQKGEIHHWDAIGMGNDRMHYDDSSNRKICLCRTHHTIAHSMGNAAFAKSYHVYGIVWTHEDIENKTK